MRARLIALAILLLAACNSGDDGPSGTGSSREVSLVGEQVVCDSCTSVRLVLAGPGIADVRSATLVASGLERTELRARVTIDLASGPSGDQLIVTAYFDQGVPEGEFDLWLDPLAAGDAARIVSAALRVTRARPGPGTLATVRVYVQVSGVDRDFGYTFRAVAGCDSVGCASLPVEPFTGASLSLLPGTYTFRLDDVRDGCTIEGAPNPATLELQRGQFVALSYRLTCAPVANPGWVRVSNVTTGPEADVEEDYQVSCSGADCRAFTLAVNRDTVLRLAPGQVTLGLTGVAAHCSASSPTTLTLTVSAGDTATAAFAVACRERPSIFVTVSASGREIDESVVVVVCYQDYYGGFCRQQAVSSGGTARFAALPEGFHSVRLVRNTLAENCGLAGSDTRSVELRGASVSVEFAITCRGFGTVRVRTVTSGVDQDASYHVWRCGDFAASCVQAPIASSGSIDLRAVSGLQRFSLSDVAPNCVVTTANPVDMTVIEDGVIDLRFDVTCRSFGIVRVSVVTSGTNQDASYEVRRPGDCDDYYVSCDRRYLGSSSSVDFRTAPGPETFLLADVAPNCTATSANPASVTAIEGGVVDLRFEVVCR